MMAIDTHIRVSECRGWYYTIIDFNELDIRIYLPEKVIIHRGRLAEVNITFKDR